MYFSSWFQSFICINLFDSMKVNKLFWYCLCLFILATDKIKFAWKSTFSLILTIIARLNSVSSPPKSPHDLLTASEREIRGRGSFWKSRLKKRGRVKWSGDPPSDRSHMLTWASRWDRGQKQQKSQFLLHTYSSIDPQNQENIQRRRRVFWDPQLKRALSTPNEGEENNIYAKGRSGGARIELCRWKKLIALPLPEARPR